MWNVVSDYHTEDTDLSGGSILVYNVFCYVKSHLTIRNQFDID